MGLELGKSSLSVAERIDFFKTMSGWLNSGGGRVSTSDALRNTCEAFSHDEYASLRPRMDMIQREVASGQTPLYAALHMSGLGFKRQELAIVEAAEKSSQLRQSLPSLVAAMDMQNKARRELFSKLAGPIGIGIALILMSLGVLVFMLPMVIQPVLDRKPDALMKFPLILQFYWYASVWLRANPFVPIAVLSVPTALIVFRNTRFLKPFWNRFMLGWKVSRRLILGFNGIVIVYFMPALVRSGLPTYRVLQNLAECVSNPIIANQLRIAAQDHEAGERLSRAMEILPFRTSLVNAVSAGEATGAIADRVQDLQEPYTLELERNIKSVVGVLKFMVMAVLLPFFIISTYTALVGPIFALMEY